VAIREVSIELAGGQFTVVMGPSGCGKSTLLAVLSGLLRPDTGVVKALDQDLWQMSDSERRELRLRHFGFIFQGFNLFPTLTAREHLEMIVRWGEGCSRAEARRRAHEMLALLDLGKKANSLPGELSGGEKQRIAIGRSLIKKPAMFFADEPTSALDWAHGKHAIEQLHQASRAGATVLVVTHDARIAAFADQIIYLDDGCLANDHDDARGTP
jgi:putative ABC transport system ATP-binding protein